MRLVLPLLLVLALPAEGLCGPITFSLRAAHFFGGTPGSTREVLESGAFTSGSSENLSHTFSTGGSTPVVFTGTSASQGTPFELSVANLIEAGETAGLQSNIAPFDPIPIVSLVQSRVQENGLFASGASGVGYLLPTFRVEGAFEDAHASASANLAICAGIPSCPLTGLGVSSGGAQTVDTLFTPVLAPQAQFTFDVPFNYFFFVSAGVQSAGNAIAAGGPLGGDFRLQIVGYKIVDANGVEIPVPRSRRTSSIRSPCLSPQRCC